MGHMGSWAIPMVSLALNLPTFPPESPGYKSGAPHHEKAGTPGHNAAMEPPMPAMTHTTPTMGPD